MSEIKISSVEAGLVGDIYVVTVRGPRRKVLVRESFISEKIGKSFYNTCKKRMEDQRK